MIIRIRCYIFARKVGYLAESQPGAKVRVQGDLPPRPAYPNRCKNAATMGGNEQRP